MKRGTIWLLGAIMAVSFIVLLFLQINYMARFVSLRKSQFDEIVNRSLSQAANNVELNETRLYLENLIAGHSNDDVRVDADTAIANIQNSYSTFELADINANSKVVVENKKEAERKFVSNAVKKLYVQHRASLDRVIYNMIEAGKNVPLKDRLNFHMLDQEVKYALKDNGLALSYHIKVLDANNNILYQCSDYDERGGDTFFRSAVYKNIPDSKNAFIEIHFPDYSDYMTDSFSLIIPSVAFTVILLVTFIVTIYLIFRQKKLSEIKSDFISNMTHEFKTPISTISLAAQMLKDESVAKSPAMLKHISGVINDETKRLRFQVDKVLQMSMFERQETTLKKVELDCNKIIDGVVNTFVLKVDKFGGSIDSHLDAANSQIYVDEMHFTNVIFNLMDNAVKYRKESEPLHLIISTVNVGSDKICISLQDNGIGIKKDDVKRVFEKFYRVHTGNVHNVKGFGLGLAYVNKIVKEHKGTIKCESELGKGTKFLITIPIIKNN